SVVGAGTASAQSLNWEGQDGIFVTPLAYTVPGTTKGFGIPAVAYHYVGAGDVLGGFHQVSITEGVYDRLEFGYTRNFHQDGSTRALSPVGGDGLNISHAKVGALREKGGALPAISLGVVARTQVHNAGGFITNKNTKNRDFCGVVPKTADIRHLPLV